MYFLEFNQYFWLNYYLIEILLPCRTTVQEARMIVRTFNILRILAREQYKNLHFRIMRGRGNIVLG